MSPWWTVRPVSNLELLGDSALLLLVASLAAWAGLAIADLLDPGEP